MLDGHERPLKSKAVVSLYIWELCVYFKRQHIVEYPQLYVYTLPHSLLRGGVCSCTIYKIGWLGQRLVPPRGPACSLVGTLGRVWTYRETHTFDGWRESSTRTLSQLIYLSNE